MVGATFGPELVSSSEICEHESAGLRLVCAGLNVKQMGRLLARAADIAASGYMVQRVGTEAGAVLWRVVEVPEFPRVETFPFLTRDRAGRDDGRQRYSVMSLTATRPVSILPAGTAFTRYLMVRSIQEKYGTKAGLDEAARLTNTPQVYATLEAELQGKAAVAAGLTSDATFAGPLAMYGIAQEALQLIRGASIIGALEGKMRRVPFRTKVAARDRAAARAARGSGKDLGTPAAATAYDTLSQEAVQSRQDRRAVGRTPEGSATRTRSGPSARRWSRAWPRISTANF